MRCVRREPRRPIVCFSKKLLAKGIGQRDEGLFKRIAVAYLLEEAAVFCCLVDAGWPVLVYPGGIKTFQEISEGHHPEAPASLRQLHLLALRLKS
jgi:hypothetical protein